MQEMKAFSGSLPGAVPFVNCYSGWEGSDFVRKKLRKELHGSHRGMLHSIELGKQSCRSGGGEVMQCWLTFLLRRSHAFVGSPNKRKGRICRAIATPGEWEKTKTRRKRPAQKKEEAPYEKQRELLSQVRKRKELEILQRSEESGPVPSEEVSVAETIWPFWRKKEFEMRALTRRIMELSKRRQLDQVFEEVECAKKKHQKLNRIIMNAVMAACVHCEDINRALRVFDEMVQPGGCSVDNVTYGTLLRGLGSARRLDDAFEVLESMEAGTAPGRPQLTDVHLNSLVNACADSGDARRARGVLLRYRTPLNRTGVTTFTYNLLIKGYARSDNPLEAFKLIDEMRSHGLHPQRLTFNSLMLACVRGGDMSRGLRLLADMKEEAKKLKTSLLLPDVVTYTTLIKGLAQVGDLEGVRRVVSEMNEAPTCVLDRVAYTAIIDACIDVGSPQEGLSVLEEMQAKAKEDLQLRPRAHVFLALMRAFAERGDVQMVGSLRDRMVPEAAGHVWAEDRAEADELYIEAAVIAGQLGIAKYNLKNMVGLKKGLPLSKRAYMAVVRLQALTGFCEDIFSPYILRRGVSPFEQVENIMVPYAQARPVLGDAVLRSVALRFFREDVVPIVDERGCCIGIVYAEDCREMSARLRDIMRPPPPAVTNASLVSKAITMLLEPQTKLLQVISSRTAHFPNKEEGVYEQALGFLTRDTTFETRPGMLFGI